MDSPKSTQELLEKYWAAETTPEEEAALRKSLQQQDQGAVSAYFRLLDQESRIAMTKEVAPLTKTARVFSLRRMLSIAASILLLVAAGLLIQRTMMSEIPMNDQANVDTYDDPEAAYEETRQALLLISEKLNKSTEKASEELSKAQPYIDILK